jgi:preprotein translocase subunit SecF
MYIWGGPGLRGFTFAMLVGIIVGTYSSIAIAAPILLLGAKKHSAKLKK